MTRARALAIASLAVLAGGVYANSLANGFALDDQAIIETNEEVHGLEHLGEAVTGAYWPGDVPARGMYRPLVLATYTVDWEIGGGSPFVFHLVNVLLHAAVTVLVLLLLLRLGADLSAAWAGAAVFAVHPVHVEAVANIVGRAEILAALFLVGACILYLRGRRRWGTAVGVGTLYLLALASKENAIMLPGILLLFHLYEEGRVHAAAREARAAWPVYAALVAALGVYFALRKVNIGVFLGTTSPAWFWGMAEEVRIFTAIRVWPEYLRLLLVPVDLVPDYGPGVIVPQTDLLQPLVLLGLLTAAVVALVAWKAWPRLPLVTGGIAWFVATALPVMGILFPVGVILAERTLYIPSVGVALAVASLAMWLRRSQRSLRPAAVLLALVVAAGAARTWTANPVWRDSLTVLNHLMDHHPANYRVQWGLANHYTSQGDTAAALSHMALATRMVPGYVGLRGQYGDLLYQTGQYDRAVAQFDTALQVIPEARAIREYLVLALLQQDRPGDAADAAADGLRISPTPTLYGLHARALARAGDFSAAAQSRRKAIEAGLDAPEWAQWTHLAALELLAGDTAAAGDALQNASETAPGADPTPTMSDLQRLVQPANRDAIPLW